MFNCCTFNYSLAVYIEKINCFLVQANREMPKIAPWDKVLIFIGRHKLNTLFTWFVFSY